MSKRFPKHMMGIHFPKHMAGIHLPKHMGQLKILKLLQLPGMTRLILSVIASAIVLPIVLRLYLNVGLGTGAQDIWVAFAQTVPFGEDMAVSMLSLWGEAQSGLDSVLKYITNQKHDFALHFSFELVQLIFCGVLMTLVGEVLKKVKAINVEGGLLDTIANAVCQLSLAFLASLLVDCAFRVIELSLVNTEYATQSAIMVVYMIVLSGGAAAALLLCGVIFYFIIALAAVGCLKLCVSYCMFLWILLARMQGGSFLVTLSGVAFWLASTWILQKIEQLFLPHSKV